jgi:hypothetical protein
MYETLTGTLGLKSKVARTPNTSNLPNQASIFKDLQGLSRILMNSTVTPLQGLSTKPTFDHQKFRNWQIFVPYNEHLKVRALHEKGPTNTGLLPPISFHLDKQNMM